MTDQTTEVLRSPVVLALRPREAAMAISISERKLWEITADADSGIPYIKLGTVVLYPVSGLERWLNEQAERRTGQ
jgi:hypothetical protein